MEPLITTAEIAEAFGVSVWTVRSWRRASAGVLLPGKPPFPKEVRQGMYRPRDLAAWAKADGREYPKEWDKA